MVKRNLDLDFMLYTNEPAKWFDRYQRQCRVHFTKEQKDAEQKRFEEKQALGKV